MERMESWEWKDDSNNECGIYVSEGRFSWNRDIRDWKDK